MSRTWCRTFEVSAPLERVWDAFTTARQRPVPAGTRSDPNADAQLEVLESQPMKRLRWAQEGGTLPERYEITVVFESTATGSRFTVTRFGFGEGRDADVFSEANAVGWEAGLMDLVFELETGHDPMRHYFGAWDACTGVMFVQRDWGLEVLSVLPHTFGSQAGLARGDRIVRLAGAAVFTRANVWMLLEQHEPGDEVEVEFVRDRKLNRTHARLSSARAPGRVAIGE
jgi:uncharacterized protein YndB with AHSA1/START domain